MTTFLTITLTASLSIANQRLEWFQGKTFSKHDKNVGWGIGYDNDINSHLSAGFYYLNEGNIKGDKRDGIAPILFYNQSIFDDHLYLSLGAGPYFYAATLTSGQQYTDKLGIGTVIDLSLRYNLPYIPLYAELSGKQIITFDNKNTQMLALGIGVNFADLNKNATPLSHSNATNNHLKLFYGESIINSVNDEKGASVNLEFEHRFNITSAYSFGLAFGSIYESSNAKNYHLGGKLKRLDFYSQATWHAQLNDYLGISVGAGPDFMRTINQSKKSNHLGGVFSTTLDITPIKHISLLARWTRIISFNNTDTDIFAGGIAYNF